MNREEKLAKLILIEAETLNDCKSVDSTITIARELTKDAIELAKIIELKSQEETMSKVIDIMTKEPLEALPFNKEESEELLAYLLNYKILLPDVSFSERYILNHVIKFLENNSGADTMEIMERKKA